MGNNEKRLTPEEALEKYQHEERGKLKIFIGYAPGVGKTYTMLNEGNRRLKRGDDIVIGYVESHNREETDNQISDLEIIPTKKIEYNNKVMIEVDVEAIILRKPKIVLIDELAHTNVPGSKNKKRYMDIEEILSHGINVTTTVNIQHLESLNDVIKKITGVTVSETIPDYIIEKADEIVVVDVSPDSLQNRLKRGNVYTLEKVPQALKNFFRKGNLSALRELVLRQTAEEVDDDLEKYLKTEGINENWKVVERVMVCISPSPTTKKLIRRGSRIANRYKCEWIVVSVNCTHFWAKKPSLRDKQIINGHFQLAKQLGAEVITLTGKSVSDALATFAHERHITQIIIGHQARAGIEKFFRGSTVNKLMDMAKNIEIHIIPNTSL